VIVKGLYNGPTLGVPDRNITSKTTERGKTRTVSVPCDCVDVFLDGESVGLPRMCALELNVTAVESSFITEVAKAWEGSVAANMVSNSANRTWWLMFLGQNFVFIVT